MLEIFENETLKCTQLLNETDRIIMQLSWEVYDREWAYETAKIKKKEIEEYRKEHAQFGYTKGMRHGMDD